MKTITKLIALLFAILISSAGSYAQVAVNADGTQPDNSAMLDVKSTNKGILIPRMTTAQRDAIVSPANGLMIFCTDNNQLYTNKGIPTSPIWAMSSGPWDSYGSSIYYNSGNVGIGFINPSQRLQVNGNISADYGSETTPSYTFYDGSENTGFASPVPKSLSIITNGTERIRVNSNGKIGIGEANPAYPLNFGYQTGEKISLHGAGATHYGFGIQDYQMQIFTDASNSDISFGYGSSTAFTETVRIKGNGNVGIGVSTPGYPLTFAPAWGDKISLAGLPGLSYGFGAQDGEMQLFTPNNDITFGTKTGSNFLERVRIKNSGRVGIGVVNPAYRLDVNGDINTTGVFRVNGVPIGTGGSGSCLWTPTGSDIYYNSGQVMIGTTTPPTNQKLYVESSAIGPAGNYAEGIRSLVNGPATGTSDAIAVHGIATTGEKNGIGGQFEGRKYGLKAICLRGTTTTGAVTEGIALYASSKDTLTGSSDIASIKSYAKGEYHVTGYDAEVEGKGTADVKGIDLNVHGDGPKTGINLYVNGTNQLTGMTMFLNGENNNLPKTGIDITASTPQNALDNSGEMIGTKTMIYSNAGEAYGAKNYAWSQLSACPFCGTDAYGTWSRAVNKNYQDATSNAIAVWGQCEWFLPGFAPPGYRYAAYFDGNIGLTGMIVPMSDRKLKSNIKPIENVLDKIKQLNPSSYIYNKQEYPWINFAEGTRFGFVAQDIEQVFPQLVSNDQYPKQYDDKGNKIHDAVQYKGVAYLEIIPILAAGIKEQQVIIEKQESTIRELQIQVSEFNTRMAAIEQMLKK